MLNKKTTFSMFQKHLLGSEIRQRILTELLFEASGLGFAGLVEVVEEEISLSYCLVVGCSVTLKEECRVSSIKSHINEPPEVQPYYSVIHLKTGYSVNTW